MSDSEMLATKMGSEQQDERRIIPRVLGVPIEITSKVSQNEMRCLGINSCRRGNGLPAIPDVARKAGDGGQTSNEPKARLRIKFCVSAD